MTFLATGDPYERRRIRRKPLIEAQTLTYERWMQRKAASFLIRFYRTKTIEYLLYKRAHYKRTILYAQWRHPEAVSTAQKRLVFVNSTLREWDDARQSMKGKKR